MSLAVPRVGACPTVPNAYGSNDQASHRTVLTKSDNLGRKDLAHTARRLCMMPTHGPPSQANRTCLTLVTYVFVMYFTTNCVLNLIVDAVEGFQCLTCSAPHAQAWSFSASLKFLTWLLSGLETQRPGKSANKRIENTQWHVAAITSTAPDVLISVDVIGKTSIDWCFPQSCGCARHRERLVCVSHRVTAQSETSVLHRTWR